MENLTILEAARLLGYTKNAVKYQVNKLPPEMTQKDANGVIHITPEGLEVLRGKMGDKQPDKNQQKTTHNQQKNHARTGQRFFFYRQNNHRRKRLV